MIYHIAFYNKANPTMPFLQLQSQTPFHSVAVGQRVQLPNSPALQILDVSHAFTKDQSGADHTMMMLMLGLFGETAAFAEQAGGNPVPWPW